jgi:hypothetical protein
MSTYSRAGFNWNINEILSLQREFELLGWSIDDIAVKHKRSPKAIMFKLDQECFADYNQLNAKMSVETSQLSLNDNVNNSGTDEEISY